MVTATRACIPQWALVTSSSGSFYFATRPSLRCLGDFTDFWGLWLGKLLYISFGRNNSLDHIRQDHARWRDCQPRREVVGPTWREWKTEAPTGAFGGQIKKEVWDPKPCWKGFDWSVHRSIWGQWACARVFPFFMSMKKLFRLWRDLFEWKQCPVCHRQDLWHLSPDAKCLSALLLYSKLKESGGLPARWKQVKT